MRLTYKVWRERIRFWGLVWMLGFNLLLAAFVLLIGGAVLLQWVRPEALPMLNEFAFGLAVVALVGDLVGHETAWSLVRALQERAR